MPIIYRRARLGAALVVALLPSALFAQTSGLDEPRCARTVFQKDPEALAYYWGCRAAGQRPDDPCAAVLKLAGASAGVAGPEGTLAGRCRRYMRSARPSACGGSGLESGLCRGFTDTPSGPICDDYGAHLAAKYCSLASQSPHLWRTPYRITLDPDSETARYQRGLDLTAEQAAKARAILDAAHARLDRLAALEDADRRELMRLDRRMQALNARYESEDDQLVGTDAAARRAVRALLNQEQSRRFDLLDEARRQVDRETDVKDQEESERPKDAMPPSAPVGPR